MTLPWSYRVASQPVLPPSVQWFRMIRASPKRRKSSAASLLIINDHQTIKQNILEIFSSNKSRRLYRGDAGRWVSHMPHCFRAMAKGSSAYGDNFVVSLSWPACCLGRVSSMAFFVFRKSTHWIESFSSLVQRQCCVGYMPNIGAFSLGCSTSLGESNPKTKKQPEVIWSFTEIAK